MAHFSPQDLPDHVLVQRALDGDNTAFQRLLSRYTGMMIAYAHKITNSRADAEDAVQEAFITAWKSLASIKDPTKVKSWLMRIVGHKAVDIVRGKRDSAALPEEFVADTDAEPSIKAERNEQLAAVRQELAKLPDLQRHCWVLREIGGYSYKEISRELRIPISTVRGNIARSRKSILNGLEVQK